jgi:hypothetical protein
MIAKFNIINYQFNLISKYPLLAIFLAFFVILSESVIDLTST